MSGARPSLRVLLASTRAGPSARRLGTLGQLLRARGHAVRWSLPEASRGARGVLEQSAALARALVFDRPDAAILRLSPGALGLATVIRAARVPLVIDVDDAEREPSPGDLPPEALEAAVMSVLRLARATTAASPTAAARARTLGGPRVAVVRRVEVPAMLPGTHLDARRALDLPEHMPWLAHVGPIRRDLEAITEAQRRLPGVGLLVIADGEGDHALHAAAMAARPSSPVVALGPEAKLAAIWAADAVIWLAEPSDDAATAPLLLGRRAIVREDLGLYPSALGAALVAPPVLPAIEAALRSPALPKAEVEAARRRAADGPIDALEVALCG